jgi:Skp family chaperone for outer membrane proteins
MMFTMPLARILPAALLAAAIASSAAAQTAAPAAAPSATPAAASQSLIVIVVDPSRIMQESKAGKSFQSQMQQKVQTYQKSISQEEQQLYNEQQELGRQQSILAQDAFASKAKDFESRVGDAKKRAQNSQREIAQGQNQAQLTIENKVLEIVSSIAKERNANLVLTRQTVMLFDKSFDVTDETIKRLDAAMPAITVTFTPVADAGGAAAGDASAAGTGAKPAKKKN